MGRLQKGVNDLESWCLNNGEFGKQLMNEWTGLCEDGSHYKIDEVSFGSAKRFKWICSKGHKWFAMVYSRTSRKTGCPYCYSINHGKILSKAKLSKENSLKTWCLNNSSFGKQLMNEWTGECTDGEHYEINEVAKASAKRFKWKCSKGHEWSARVHDRTSHKAGCPYCYNANRSEISSKAKLSNENSLKTWCLSMGSFGKQLLNEWTGECEDGEHYEIAEAVRGSGKKFKWKCDKDHEWYATIYSRTSLKHGCPYCLRDKLQKGVNDLETWCSANGSFGKQLKSEWTGECSEGAHYNIDQVTKASGKKFKWRCSKDHEWFSTVANRTSRKHGCPYCSEESRSEIVAKAMLSEKNSLKTWCLNNGSWGKQLMSEWTGMREDKKHFKIDEVARASGKNFKWKCSKGHEWFARIADRTTGKRGCPYCNNIGTSYPEQFIYHSLKQIYPSAENRCKVLKSQQNPQGIEFDIGVPEIPLCIEYSSTYWHEGREERDQYKKDLCKQCGIRLIQIVEDSYDELPLKMESDYICFKMNYSQQDEILEVIVDHILNSLGHSISEIDIERVKQEAYESSKGIEKEMQDTD